MKRTMAFILALLMLAGCGTAGARAQGNPPDSYRFTPVETGESFAWDEYGTAPENELLAASIQAGMRTAGRDAVGLGLTACAVDPLCRYACVLAAREDVLQLTILEKTADDRWLAVAWNDTIPAGVYGCPSLRWAQSAVMDEETGQLMTLDIGRFRLSGESFAWEGSERDTRSTQILELARDDAGVWRVYALRDARFDQAAEGRCPYLTLDSLGGWPDQWVLRTYDMVRLGRAWERTACQGQAILAEADLAGRDAVNALDYPGLLEYLRAVPPDAASPSSTPQPADREQALVAAAERLASLLNEDGTVYYNPDGGRYYHTSRVCAAEDPDAWPLSPLPYETLSDPWCAYLEPCPVCGAPERPPVETTKEN